MIPANSWMNSMAASTIKKTVLAEAPTNFEVLPVLPGPKKISG
jgi:hypothetical protein